MRTLPGKIAGSIGPGDNVLLLCPSFGATSGVACTDLLSSVDPARARVFVVTFTDSPRDRLAVWDEHVDTRPAEVAFVSVDAATRSVVDGNGALPEGADGFDVTVDHVSSPENLTRLGVTITSRLDEWADDGDHRVVACFNSVSALLQYASPRKTFEFLNVLTDRFRVADAVAHYHMDPRAHDTETVELLQGLFDVVCECDDGEWTVRGR